MMSDHDLAAVLARAIDIEQRSRAYWQACGTDLAEKDAALHIVRHITGVRRSLETWISDRALRAALHAMR